MGAFTTLTAGLINYLLLVQNQYESFSQVLASDFLFFYGVSVNEEIHKFLPVIICHSLGWIKIRRPIDAVLFSTMSALGFASLENIQYTHEYGLETGLLRTIFAVPLHGLCGIIIGYFLGLCLINRKPAFYVLYGLILAIICHTAHNTGMFSSNPTLMGSVLSDIIAVCISAYMIRSHNRYKDLMPIPKIFKQKTVKRTRLVGANGLTILNKKSMKEADQPCKTYDFPKEWRNAPWPPPEIENEAIIPKEWLNQPWPPNENNNQ
jgi:RsiW-degrading membrane proteinase PrsW (M82 family)